MNKAMKIFLYFFVATFVLLGVITFILINFMQDVESPNTQFYISSKDISQVMQDAKKGDINSAMRLYQYYEHIEHDEQKMLYWLTYAAERGEPIAQYNLAFYYQEQQQDYEKARFWYKKAATTGDKQALKKLKDLEIIK